MQNRYHRFCLIVFVMIILSSCTTVEKEYFANGNLKHVFHKKNDKFDGLAEWYYNTGGIKQSCTYKDNKLHGLNTRYHPNGRPQLTENYKNGLRQGTSKSFYINGKIESNSFYNNDTLHGDYFVYHSDGTRKIEGKYKNGLFEGKWYYFDMAGNLIGLGIFESGNGLHKAWYQSGELKREVQYQKNLKHGKETWWKEDGKIEKVIIYGNDEVVETIE
ncbi:MAG: toxin-antitoxin system YwqK family antitoxin [Bacteroidales bacterium]|nr:toxin-antitoxin system YwqK family antitoxin [Bacteroidales bacterium]